ncbi:MAG: class I tRNA ligase family protein [Patescibacteria group bacterium]
MSNKFYITTPIYYVNAGPHLGHTYTTVAADVLARAHRLLGDKTFFLTGTDEHGAKIQEIAEKAGLPPKEFTDGIAGQFKEAWQDLHISNDRFIRTTEEPHMSAVSKALQYMYEKGDIYKGSYEGLYCKGCEQFKSENDLVDGLCADHKTKPEIMEEESYMFKLSAYADKLQDLIERDEIRILPASRKNEILSFYKNEGLKDISFSRKNVAWGIPVPWDRSHTIYVWADAFLNYLTGIGWNGVPDSVPEFWPADVQLMSKDILRVHATIWPAMLLSLGLPLPKTLFVHGFFLIDGQKMSKSIGNVISPDQLVKRYGVDATKYLLMSATPFGNDGDVSWKQFDDKYNADLANGLGNLVQRVATLIENNLNDGLAYKAALVSGENSFFEYQEFNTFIGQFELHQALAHIWTRIGAANAYVNEHKPWVSAKENPETFLKTMTVLTAMVHHIVWLLQPFMPDTTKKIFEIFGDAGAKYIKDDYRFKVKKNDTGLFPRLES